MSVTTEAACPVMSLPTGRPARCGVRRSTHRWPLPQAAAAPPRAAGIAAALAGVLVRHRHRAEVLLAGDADAARVAAPASDIAIGALVGEPQVLSRGTVEPYLPVHLVTVAGTSEADAVWRIGSAGTVEVDFDPDVYDDDTMAAICRHVGRLLEAAAATPGVPLRRAPLLTDAERQLLLGAWNGNPVAYEGPARLSDFFFRRAAVTPDAVALVQGDRRLDYRELESLTASLRTALLDAGARPGAAVAVHAGLSPELFAAVLAIFQIGATFVYLDPADPDARLLQAARLAGAGVVLVDAPRAQSPVGGDRPLQLEDAAATPPSVWEAPGPVADPEDIAYVLFTSGSTGEPKGVRRSHRMCGSRVLAEQAMYGFGAADRHLLKSPISWRELIWPLATGGACVMPDAARSRDDRHLVDVMADHGVTVASFVPSMWRVLLDAGLERCRALRHAFAGGEPLGADVERRLRDRGLEVHNTYVLTEAEWVAVRPGPTDRVAAHSIIGRPIDMRLYLLDEDGALVAPGVPGEICTGGPGLASGYLGAEALTAERFVPDPFAGDGSLMFKTRDLARHLGDGQLEYLGRADRRVKVRGLLVDPSEVERALNAHPEVAAAVVVGRPDDVQGSRLDAYVVLRDADVAYEDLHATLKGELPAHMVPRRLVVLDRLPLMPSGKPDYSALASVTADRPPLRVPHRHPRDELERQVAAAFEEVLGLEGIGVDDDFKLLGGDSMLAMVLRRRLSDMLGVPVPLSDLVEAPTVATLASRLRDTGDEARVPETHGPRRAGGLGARARRLRAPGEAGTDG